LGSRFRKPSLQHDHWHRTGDDPGRPYAFEGAAQLIEEFFTEVRRVLAEHGLDDAVIGGERGIRKGENMKVQSMKALEAEMKAVARGEIAAPPDAHLPSVESAEALIRLLTPENRSLLRTICDAEPQSVAELARLTNRAEPNLLRTLGKLEAFGLLAMQTVERRKVPTATVGTLRLEIDPYEMADHIEVRPRGGIRASS